MQTKFTPTRIRIGQSRYFWNRPKSSLQTIMSLHRTIRKHHFPANVSLCSRRCEQFLWQKKPRNMAFFLKILAYFMRKNISWSKSFDPGQQYFFVFEKSCHSKHCSGCSQLFGNGTFVEQIQLTAKIWPFFGNRFLPWKIGAAGENFGKVCVPPMRFSWKTTMFL